MMALTLRGTIGYINFTAKVWGLPRNPVLRRVKIAEREYEPTYSRIAKLRIQANKDAAFVASISDGSPFAEAYWEEARKAPYGLVPEPEELARRARELTTL